MKYLICHLTSQSHVIEGPCNFLSRFSSWCVTTLPGLVAIGIVVVEINGSGECINRNLSR